MHTTLALIIGLSLTTAEAANHRDPAAHTSSPSVAASNHHGRSHKRGSSASPSPVIHVAEQLSHHGSHHKRHHHGHPNRRAVHSVVVDQAASVAEQAPWPESETVDELNVSNNWMAEDGGEVTIDGGESEAGHGTVWPTEGEVGSPVYNDQTDVRIARSRLRSTCNMSPHVMYYPEAHGYYYFRPYNWPRVVAHQQIVTRWGGDWRDPYKNDVFERVYARLGVDGNGQNFGVHGELVPVPASTDDPFGTVPAPDEIKDAAPGIDDHEIKLPSDLNDESPADQAQPGDQSTTAPPSADEAKITPRPLIDWRRLQRDLLSEEISEAELVQFVTDRAGVAKPRR